MMMLMVMLLKMRLDIGEGQKNGRNDGDAKQ